MCPLGSDYWNLANTTVFSFSLSGPHRPLNEKQLPAHPSLVPFRGLNKIHAIQQQSLKYHYALAPEAF